MIGTRCSIPQITEHLRQTQDRLTEIITNMPDSKFFEGTDENWSAANYVKHLILSLKPFAKGLNLPHDKIAAMFDLPTAPSRTYDELIEAYRRALAGGVRAQLFPPVMPTGYRMPDGVTDEKSYLIETWQDANQRVFTALEGWTEAQLDEYQMPHPAIGTVTVRELLYFNMYHNQMHTDDIARCAGIV
jgi:uncharacterized damage-inducible protein DinB